jgi:hypothetical protein
MTDTQSKLIHLIATGGSTEDAKILAEAKLQAVYTMVNQSSPYARQLVSHNIVNQYEHKEVGGILESAGVPYVVLKGLASASYYPEPLHRTMGDVDVLVYPSDLQHTEDAMIAAGFEREPGDNGKHIGFKRGSTVVEVHWRVNGIPDGNEPVEALLSDIIPKASKVDGVMMPSPFHHGIVLLLHTVEHLINTGIGLRHLCDWCYFADSLGDREFAGLFENALRSIGLWRFAQILTLVGIRYLNMEDREWAHCDADGSVIAALMDDILNAGNFGVKEPQRINQAKLMQANNKIQDHALLGALTAKVKQEWPLSRSFPVIIPAGWIYIGVRHLVRIRQGKRPKMDVKNMVSGASRRRSIYKELRLFEVE